MHWDTFKQDIITAQWERMMYVGLARNEPALLSTCSTIRVLSYSNCQRSTHSISRYIYVALNVDNCGMYTFNGSSVECIHSIIYPLNVHIPRLRPVECIHSMGKTWNVYNPWPIVWNVDRNKP